MEANDLTGLGKLADSKLANRIYKEGLSPTAQELGKLATDVVKSFRLFLAPVQLLSVAQDRLAGFLERVRSDVPDERQIDAVPSIAGPVLQRLVYVEDDNPLLDLYLNLLKRAIDKERSNKAHPAFLRIIEQLSSDESLMLWVLHNQGDKCNSYWPDQKGLHPGQVPLSILAFPNQLDVYVSHLESLNLLQITPFHRYLLHYHEDANNRPKTMPREEMHGLRDWLDGQGLGDTHLLTVVGLTEFGHLFGKACIPATLPEAIKS